jgi:outer membrane protein TolC
MSRTLPPASVGLLALVGLLAACTAGPDFKAPAPPPPQAGYAADGDGRAALGEGPAQGWWKAFGSPAMDALVDQALARNHTLAASIATLERARAQVDAVAGRRLPQVDANARADYEKFNLNAFGLGDRFGTSI